jgi:hypothetical protein
MRSRPAGLRVRSLALLVVACIASLPMRATAEDAPAGIETLVFIRHGEKPSQGLGLLTCQGLNRALLLPDWFAAHFPRPDYIFAPDPKVKATEIHGDGMRYDYVRPLLTIGPTAVRLGIPINTQLPFNDPGLLADTLLEPQYHAATIYLAWEHTNIEEFAAVMQTRFGNRSQLPAWPNSDYDTVFVFTIKWTTPARLDINVTTQQLGPIADICPKAAAAN